MPDGRGVDHVPAVIGEDALPGGGALMDLDAVAAALAEGRLAGVAMDAYEREPPDFSHPVFDLPSVIATPHASAWVTQTFQRISQVGAENLWAALSGERPEHAVNPEVL